MWYTISGGREDPLKVRTLAVVGASRDPAKDAYRVPEYLVRVGYVVVPVNPSADEILGRKAYPSLLDIPADIASRTDVIDGFRLQKKPSR